MLDRRDETPILARWEGWTNAEKQPLPPSLNLLAAANGRVSAWLAVPDGKRPPAQIVSDKETTALSDGATQAPAMPWIDWQALSMIDSGWRGKPHLEIEFPKKNVRLTGNLRLGELVFHGE